MDDVFDLNYQYSLYLERVGLHELDMSTIQRIEMKRVFFGACGQMLMIMHDDIADLDDDDAVNKFQDMINQVSNFFLKETNKQN